MPDRTVEQVHAKSAAYRRVITQDAYRRLRLACDVWTAAFVQPFTPDGPALTTMAVQEALTHGALSDPRQGAFVTVTRDERAFFHWSLEFPDAAAAGGFDVILGNPPFIGGPRISGVLGDVYRQWLRAIYHPFQGNADLCAAFFRRAFALLRPGGRLGMIATNSIGQGDTRESGLKVILAQGGRIAFARRFVRWPGQASVEVNLVVIEAPRATPQPPLPAGGNGGAGSDGGALLDDRPVAAISSRLDAEPDGEPARLRQNDGKAFIGDFVRGIGFVLEAAEAEALLAHDPRNADCLFPYLNGDDLNTHPAQQPGRWVICFHDWDLARAQQYPDLLRIVEERVKPERNTLRSDVANYDRIKQCWWLYSTYAQGMRCAIKLLRRVLARSRISEMHALAFVPRGWIYNEKVIVFAFDDDYHFALLQSSVHEVWMRQWSSTLRTDINYAPTDCFATFPFPPAEYAAPSPQSPPPAGGDWGGTARRGDCGGAGAAGVCACGADRGGVPRAAPGDHAGAPDRVDEDVQPGPRSCLQRCRHWRPAADARGAGCGDPGVLRLARSRSGARFPHECARAAALQHGAGHAACGGAAIAGPQPGAGDWTRLTRPVAVDRGGKHAYEDENVRDGAHSVVAERLDGEQSAGAGDADAGAGERHHAGKGWRERDGRLSSLSDGGPAHSNRRAVGSVVQRG
jgi:hypothetical protein